MLAILGPAIEEERATVEVGELPTIEAEPQQLAQLLQNLIGNAVKFHAPGAPPVVRVTARRTIGGRVVTVADDGIGIPEADQERIFAMFTRLHGREEYAGTGIGLAICRRIAERHGGRIYVESEPGRGAAFHTLLPDAPRRAGRASARAARTARRPQPLRGRLRPRAAERRSRPTPPPRRRTRRGAARGVRRRRRASRRRRARRRPTAARPSPG